MNTTLRYTIIILSPAYGKQNATLAFQFCEALIQKKHIIENVFFYMDGVHNANSFSDPASDEFDIVEAWQAFSLKHQIAFNACHSAARRRGISEQNCAAPFRLSGLSQLSDAIATSDRVIQF